MLATGAIMTFLYVAWAVLAPFKARSWVRAVYLLVAGFLMGAGL